MQILYLLKRNYKFFIPFLPILALFVLYPIPPIADCIGHVAFSIVPTGAEEFYINNFGISYRALHWILKLPQLIFGNNYSIVSAFGMIFMFSILLSVPAVYIKLKKGPTLFIIGFLVAPTLFLLDAKLFLWGTFPSALGAWLSILFILIYNNIDDRISKKNLVKRNIIFNIILLLIILFAHPISILYLGFGLGLIILKILFTKSSRKFCRLIYIAVIGIFLFIIMLVESHVLDGQGDGSLKILWGDHNFWERIMQIINGSLYEFKQFFPDTDYIISGLGAKLFISFMSLLPFIALISQSIIIYLLRKRKEDTSFSLLIFGLLLISCIMLITIPNNYQYLGQWSEREVLFILPLILIVFSEFILLFKKYFNSKKVLSVFIGLFFLLNTGAVYAHLNMYSKAQNIKITADKIAIELANGVEEYKKSINYSGIVLIEYTVTSIGKPDWFAYRLIPFLFLINE